MKRLLSLLLLLPLLVSCKAKSIDREMTETDVKRIVDEAIDESRFLSLDREDVDFVLSTSANEYQKAWLWIDKGGATIDEIAVLVAHPDTADALYQKLEQYVASCKADKKEWLESYNPTEAIKLESGKLFRYGNCMGYVFLSENAQEEFLDELYEFYHAE